MFHAELGDLDKRYCCSSNARKLPARTLGKTHPLYAESLNNLAYVHERRGDHKRSPGAVREGPGALQGAAWREAPPLPAKPEQPGQRLRPHGRLLQGRFPCAKRCCAPCKSTVGERHPDSIIALPQPGLQLDPERPTREGPSHGGTVRELGRAVFGEGHPHYADCSNTVACALAGLGKYIEAAPIQREALTVAKRHLDDTFSALSERQRLALLAEVRHHLDDYLRIGIAASVPTERLYDEVLAWKARRRLAPGRGAHCPRYARAGAAAGAAAGSAGTAGPTGDRRRLAAKGRGGAIGRPGEGERSGRGSSWPVPARSIAGSAVYSTQRRWRRRCRRARPWSITSSTTTNTRKRPARALAAAPAAGVRSAPGAKPVLRPLGAIAQIQQSIVAWREAVQASPPDPAADRLADQLREKLWVPLEDDLGRPSTILVCRGRRAEPSAVRGLAGRRKGPSWWKKRRSATSSPADRCSTSPRPRPGRRACWLWAGWITASRAPSLPCRPCPERAARWSRWPNCIANAFPHTLRHGSLARRPPGRTSSPKLSPGGRQAAPALSAPGNARLLQHAAALRDTAGFQ